MFRSPEWCGDASTFSKKRACKLLTLQAGRAASSARRISFVVTRKVDGNLPEYRGQQAVLDPEPL